MKIIMLLLVLPFTIYVKAQEDLKSLSLKDACLLGIEKNVNVQNAELEQHKAQAQFKEAQSKLYPQMDGYSTFGYYYAIPKMIVPGEIFGQSGLIPIEVGTKFDWSSGFKATQILYNQSYFTSLKLAQQMKKLSQLSLQQQKEEVVYQVSQIYFLCQNTEKQIELMSKTLEDTERLLEIAKLQSETGIILKVDCSRVQVNKSNLQTQIDKLEQLYKQQLGLLKYLVGIEPHKEIALSDSVIIEPEPMAFNDIGFTTRSEIQLIDKQIELSELSLKMDKQAYLPTLSGFGQYYYQGQRNEFDFFKSGGDDKFFKVGMIGISLDIPIFDGFEKRHKIKQRNIERTQLINTRENTIRFFSKEYTDAVSEYNTCYIAMQRQKENVVVAEEAYNLSLKGYRQHITSLSDLLLSKAGFTETQLSYYNVLMQLKNAGLEIKKAKGELLNF